MGGVNLKYRLKYIKTDNLVFISHLDILKVIQRAFRRANVDLEHSKGFNPHPKVHFAPPLPLFTSSMGEYMDVETKEDFKPEELLKRLNKVLPKNLCLIDAKKLEDGTKSLGKSLDCALYRITFDNLYCEDVSVLAKRVQDFINESLELIITKTNKKGRVVTKNIKPSIFDFKCEVYDNKLIINTALSLRTDEILSPGNLITVLKEQFEELRKTDNIKLEKKDTLLFSN